MVKNIERLKQILPNLKGAIFDMDGTIIDLEELNYKSYADVIKSSFEIELTKSEYHKYFSGTKTAAGFTGFLESADVNSFSVDSLITEFRSNKRFNLQNNIDQVVTLRPGTRELFTMLQDKGVKIALATSTIKEFTDIIIDHFQLHSYFHAILTADDVTVGKPDPQIFNLAAKSLGLGKNELVIFEDSLNGILAAKNAGIVCIGIYDEKWNSDFVDAADIVIENFDFTRESF